MNVILLIFFGMAFGFAVGLVASDAFEGIATSNDVWALSGAFSGAAVTVLGAIWVARHEISTRRDEAEKARQRQQRGARAILVSDLSRIADYAVESAAAAIRGNQVNDGPEPRPIVPCPELEPDILLRLQRLVEIMDADDADQIVDLMTCYQVQRARMNDILTSLNNPERGWPRGLILYKGNFEFTLPATVELHLRAVAMFPFARQEQDSIAPPPFTEDSVENAFRLLDVEEWLSDPERRAIVAGMTNLSPLGRWRQN